MLYKNLQWKKFSLRMRLINIVLAWLVAWLVWEFLPHDMWFRDWLLWMSWVVSYQIVEFVQTFWMKIIKKYTWLDKVVEEKKDLDSKSDKENE